MDSVTKVIVVKYLFSSSFVENILDSRLITNKEMLEIQRYNRSQSGLVSNQHELLLQLGAMTRIKLSSLASIAMGILLPINSLLMAGNALHVAHRHNWSDLHPDLIRCRQSRTMPLQLSMCTTTAMRRPSVRRSRRLRLHASFDELQTRTLPIDDDDGTDDTRALSRTLSTERRQQVGQSQTVAIVGSGAVGSYYGARLWEAGHDVHFYLRGDNYQAAQSRGLTVTSVEGDIFIPPDVLQAYNCTMAMAMQDSDSISSSTTRRVFDWVIVALKSTALDAIPDLVLPLLNPLTTRVLVIMNGMIEEDLLHLMRLKTGQAAASSCFSSVREASSTSRNQTSAAPPPPLECCQAWYGGMALICCNRIAPAVVDHTYFGLLSAGVASSRTGSSSAGNVSSPVDTGDNEDRRAFEALFANTIIDVSYEDSLLRGRWKKMLWNLPFNGISVAMGGITVDQIVQDAGLRRLAYAIMDETIAAANTELEMEHYRNNFNNDGKDTPPFVPLGVLERAAMMKLSDDMGPYKPSTMLDFVNRRAMEVQYLFRTPVTRAQRLGVPVPHLETIVAQIEAYQRFYNLF